MFGFRGWGLRFWGGKGLGFQALWLIRFRGPLFPVFIGIYRNMRPQTGRLKYEVPTAILLWLTG